MSPLPLPGRWVWINAAGWALGLTVAGLGIASQGRFDLYKTGTVDSQGGDSISLVLDPAGRPHIGYRHWGDLMYAHFDGTSWQIETVDGSGVGDTSLALDAEGQ